MLQTNQSSLGKLAEEPEPDVPEGALANLAQRNRPTPEQSTTGPSPAFFEETGDIPGRTATVVTPTTTGTLSGTLYGMTPEYQRPAWAPPVSGEASARATQDFVVGFATPIMKVEQLGMEEALQGIRGAERGQQRGILRRLLRAANRLPKAGPQNVRERADVIRGAAGLKSKARDEAEEYIQHNIHEIQESLRDPKYTPQRYFARDVPPAEGQPPMFETSRATLKPRTYEQAVAERRWKTVKNIDFMDWLRTRAAVERVKHPLESTAKMKPEQMSRNIEFQPAETAHRLRMRTEPPAPWPPPKGKP